MSGEHERGAIFTRSVLACPLIKDRRRQVLAALVASLRAELVSSSLSHWTYSDIEGV